MAIRERTLFFLQGDKSFFKDAGNLPQLTKVSNPFETKRTTLK
jgi:hypothetical protein